MAVNILMFGWELPPHNSGGLGVACLGLTRALSDKGANVTFVLPEVRDVSYPFETVSAFDLFFLCSVSLVSSYGRYGQKVSTRFPSPLVYGQDLFEQVARYTLAADTIAQKRSFDVIHAHDWLSFGAGVRAKEVSGKPLVAHIHATEFDRTGGNGINEVVYAKEKEGMEKADKVVAVSNFTKDMITRHYGIPSEKIQVVHNAIEPQEVSGEDIERSLKHLKERGTKIVIFVGRITLQKGPDYFLKAAKRVLEHNAKVLFIVAGSGDMETQMIQEAAFLKISDKVMFTGFLRDKELDAVYQAADLFVMPSVSEPFGITGLEAMAHGTPVLLSKQSGVSETVSHALKVDFWDTEEMANKIIATLWQGSLKRCLVQNGSQEVKKISWNEAAEKCLQIYREVLNIEKAVSNFA